MNTLSRLKQKGDEITGYFRNMTAGLLDRFECCAAGGAVVDYLNEGSVSHQGDIDVFLFDGERDFKRVSEYLQKMGYEAVYQAEHATLFKPAFSADAGAGGSPISLGGRRVFMPSLHIINTDIKHVRVYKDVIRPRPEKRPQGAPEFPGVLFRNGDIGNLIGELCLGEFSPLEDLLYLPQGIRLCFCGDSTYSILYSRKRGFAPRGLESDSGGGRKDNPEENAP